MKIRHIDVVKDKPNNLFFLNIEELIKYVDEQTEIEETEKLLKCFNWKLNQHLYYEKDTISRVIRRRLAEMYNAWSPLHK